MPRGRVPAWGALLLSACAFNNSALDDDGDGSSNLVDCAPRDPQNFPGNTEVCDGRDNDCNGLVDDGLIQTWYVDIDQDGFGDPARTVTSCYPQPGLVLVGDDCDDVQADIHPGALERCDDKDNDCVGGIDDAVWWSSFEGGWNRGGVTLLGDAEVVPEDGTTNHYLRVVRAQPSQIGALWVASMIPGERWRISFRIRLAGIGAQPGEGVALAFMKQEGIPSTSPKGPSLGIYGAEVDGWTLEFDERQSSPADSRATGRHIAFHRIRDGLRLAELAMPPNFDDGAWHSLVYLQDGTSFTVRYDGYLIWNDFLDLGADASYTVGFTATTSVDHLMQVGLDDVEVACPDTPPRDPNELPDTAQ